jgi:ribose transport system substrate-binding protein
MKKSIITLFISSALATNLWAADLPALNPDTEKDRTDWAQLVKKYGPLPKENRDLKIAGVSKTLTNAYWRSLGDGYKNIAEKNGFTTVYQAAANEGDQLGQLSIAETLITQGFDGLLVSPQTDSNLQPAYESAKRKGIPVVNVNDAVMPNAQFYVGNVQKDNGVRVANWFVDRNPEGGKLAIIQGQAGAFAARQRTEGFEETIKTNGKLQIVASIPADWSREKAYNATATILQQHPDLVGIYANNDGMALGVVEAVRAAKKSDQVAVFGTDGIADAYNSIKRGELAGTVDSFPVLTGEVAMNVLLRIIDGQPISRVVSTPQALITKENVDTFLEAKSSNDNQQLLNLLNQ